MRIHGRKTGLLARADRSGNSEIAASAAAAFRRASRI
jgi:hypothetical protein